MTTYNLTFIGKNATLMDWIYNVNVISDGLLINIFMLILFVLLYAAFKSGNKIEEAILVSSFVVTIIGFFFAAMKWMSMYNVALPLVVFMVALFFTLFGKD